MKFIKSKCERCEDDCAGKGSRRAHEKTNGMRDGRCVRCHCDRFTRRHRLSKPTPEGIGTMPSHRRSYYPEVHNQKTFGKKS